MIVDSALYRDGVRRRRFDCDATDDLRRACAARRRARPERLRLGRAARARPAPSWPTSRSSSACTRSRSRTRSTRHQRPKVERYDDMLFMVAQDPLVRRRARTPSRPARSACSSAATSSSPSATARASSCTGARHDLERETPRARPRPLRGRLRRLRPDRGRLRGGRRRAAGGRRRGRGVGLLHRPHPRQPAGSTSSSARSRSCAARCCRCASRCSGSPPAPCPCLHEDAGTVLPRRRRPPHPGRGDRSRPSTSCSRPPSTPTWPRSPSSRTTTCAGSRPWVGDRRRRHPGRRHLRHELRRTCPSCGWRFGYPGRWR